jgi:Protein of unknown function (DUF2844)
MKLESPRPTSWTAKPPHFAAIVLVLLITSGSSFAELGGYADSVEADRVKMKATLKVTQKQAYAVHEIQSATKTIVREYVGPDGHVFGVAWQGPFMPDLSHLLGSFYGQYSDAIKAENRRYVGHRPVDIRQPRLVVQGGGHMLGHFGRAFVPDMLPEGVTSDAIR